MDDSNNFASLQSAVTNLQGQVDALQKQLDSNRAFSEQMAKMLGIAWPKGAETALDQGSSGVKLSCSFCQKSEDDVKKLIAGPGVFICDECIELCNEILLEEQLIELPRKKVPFESKVGFHSSVRSFVLDAVVVEALAGAPWRELCADVMRASDISEAEVEGEMAKMQEAK